MKIGDEVEWTSQAAGSRKTKRGVIVSIVPAGINPVFISPGVDAGACSRNHDSYIVKVGTKLYWPRVSHLRLLNTVGDQVADYLFTDSAGRKINRLVVEYEGQHLSGDGYGRAAIRDTVNRILNSRNESK